jgi:predicted ATPase
MDESLDTYDLPKLNQEDINNFITNSCNKEFPSRFTAEFYQTTQELTPILLKLFHKVKREGTLQILFYELFLP